MKLNKYLLSILICSLINISETNSPIEIGNLEAINDNKRKLDEHTDNYIIIEFNNSAIFERGELLKNYNNLYISYIINENQRIYPNQDFTEKNNTKLQVHFYQPISSLYSFFDASNNGNFKFLISADFSHFDTSSVTDMSYMFYECSSLQTLNLSNFDTSSVTNMDSMFYECISLKYLITSNFNFDQMKLNVQKIFYNLSSLEYIDIYNIKDTNNKLKTEVQERNNLNTKKNLTVCQNDIVAINNTNAIYKCYNINDFNLIYNNIQTTIHINQENISINQIKLITMIYKLYFNYIRYRIK